METDSYSESPGPERDKDNFSSLVWESLTSSFPCPVAFCEAHYKIYPGLGRECQQEDTKARMRQSCVAEPQTVTLLVELWYNY